MELGLEPRFLKKNKINKLKKARTKVVE